jgi:5'-deoxynucleotidase YfbR-like HD superfamily hydrolase
MRSGLRIVMPLDYKNDYLDIFESMNGSIRRLAAIRRFSSMHVNRPESVAEHIGFASIYAFLIVLDMKSRGEEIDIERTLGRVIVHDLDETMSGDIMRGFKYSNDKILEAIQEASEQNMNDLVTEFGRKVGPSIIDNWKHSKSDDIEGDVIELVDFICVIAYCREEASIGNKLLDDIVRGGHKIMQVKFKDHPQLSRYFWQIFPRDEYTDVYRSMSDSWNRISAKR